MYALIIVAGSNNLASPQDADSVKEELYAMNTVTYITKKIVRRAYEEGVKVFMAIPSHRRDVRPTFKEEAARRISRVVR